MPWLILQFDWAGAGKARVGGKPSAKAKNRQIHKKQTTRNLLYFKPSLMALRNPARFNGIVLFFLWFKNVLFNSFHLSVCVCV